MVSGDRFLEEGQCLSERGRTVAGREEIDLCKTENDFGSVRGYQSIKVGRLITTF